MKETRAFVDVIEEGTAMLIVGEETFAVPTTLLPTGMREGTWVVIAVGATEAPADDAEERRRKLGRGDPGGDIKL